LQRTVFGVSREAPAEAEVVPGTRGAGAAATSRSAIWGVRVPSGVVPKRGGAAAARETEIGKPAALRCVTPTLRYMDANVLAFSKEVKVTSTVGGPSEVESTKFAHAS